MQKGERISDGEHRLEVRINDEELVKLIKLQRSTGFTKTRIIRDLIDGAEVKPVMSEEFRKVYIELNRIGTNLNQITYNFNSTHFFDWRGFEDCTNEIKEQISNLFYIEVCQTLGRGQSKSDWKHTLSDNLYTYLDECEDFPQFIEKLFSECEKYYQKESDKKLQ